MHCHASVMLHCMRRSSKLPKDPNQLAAKIVALSTEEPNQPKEQSPISAYLAKIGRKGGKRGGVERAKKLSAKRRSQIARTAAKVRLSQKYLNKTIIYNIIHPVILFLILFS